MKASLIPLSMIFLTILGSTALANPIEHSPNVSGVVGLNAIPSARHFEDGDAVIGVSTLDPYLHTYIGFQLAKPLYISLRQTSETSTLGKKGSRLYPGMDFKLSILNESAYRPQISIGAQSAFGHKRMAGEYIAASKRYKDFDFTAGLGWGRFGTANHIDNPFKAISSHFGKARLIDGENASGPEDWFTGEHVGAFAGIEYFTPIKGLSLKADWGADRYSAETNAFDYNKAPPWALGLSYSPADWLQTSLGIQGAEKIMARVNLKSGMQNWPFKPSRRRQEKIMSPFSKEHKKAPLKYNENNAQASIYLSPYKTTPEQLQTTSVNIINQASSDLKTITLKPRSYNLHGPIISLNRHDLETALGNNQGSAEEIWNNADIIADQYISLWPKITPKADLRPKHFRLILDNQVSLSEDDHGTLYRTSLLGDLQGPSFFGLLHSGTRVRLLNF